MADLPLAPQRAPAEPTVLVAARARIVRHGDALVTTSPAPALSRG